MEYFALKVPCYQAKNTLAYVLHKLTLFTLMILNKICSYKETFHYFSQIGENKTCSRNKTTLLRNVLGIMHRYFTSLWFTVLNEAKLCIRYNWLSISTFFLPIFIKFMNYSRCACLNLSPWLRTDIKICFNR